MFNTNNHTYTYIVYAVRYRRDYFAGFKVIRIFSEANSCLQEYFSLMVLFCKNNPFVTYNVGKCVA
jgi:hypothetical protein